MHRWSVYLPHFPQRIYKYLGIDENASCEGPPNKNRVTREYYSKLRKIWESELSYYNKTIYHNAFSLAVLTPLFGIVDCRGNPLHWYQNPQNPDHNWENPQEQVMTVGRELLKEKSIFHDPLYIRKYVGLSYLQGYLSAYRKRPCTCMLRGCLKNVMLVI